MDKEEKRSHSVPKAYRKECVLGSVAFAQRLRQEKQRARRKKKEEKLKDLFTRQLVLDRLLNKFILLHLV
jgi:hypothetical protein